MVQTGPNSAPDSGFYRRNPPAKDSLSRRNRSPMLPPFDRSPLSRRCPTDAWTIRARPPSLPGRALVHFFVFVLADGLPVARFVAGPAGRTSASTGDAASQATASSVVGLGMPAPRRALATRRPSPQVLRRFVSATWAGVWLVGSGALRAPLRWLRRALCARLETPGTDEDGGWCCLAMHGTHAEV